MTKTMWQVGFSNPSVSLDGASKIYCELHKPESAKPKRVTNSAQCWTCARTGTTPRSELIRRRAEGSRTG